MCSHPARMADRIFGMGDVVSLRRACAGAVRLGGGKEVGGEESQDRF